MRIIIWFPVVVYRDFYHNCNTIHINIQNTEHRRKQANTNTGGLCHFRCKMFYKLLTSVLRHERRDTILTMLTIPKVRRILWCLRSLWVEKPNYIFNGPNPTLNWLFSKILKFSGLFLPCMTSSTLWHHFLSGVYYENGDCHILYTRV